MFFKNNIKLHVEDGHVLAHKLVVVSKKYVGLQEVQIFYFYYF